MNKTIMIVDDHPLVCDGLAQLLCTAGFTVAGQAEDMPTALTHQAFKSCGLFIVDLSLGENSALELIVRLHKMKRCILVYSMHETSNIIRQALDAGAMGYVTKRETPAILIEAIEYVLAGKVYHSPRVIEIMSDADPTEELSVQQKQIFHLLGRGLSNTNIAQELDISVRTLESYCVRMMNKLNVSGIKELRQQAILAFKKNIFDDSQAK